MRFVRGAALALVIIAVPVFLITSNVRIVIYSDRLYNYGFDKYGISEVTGIERPHLMRVAGEIKDYFSDDTSFLESPVVMGGVERQLFNGREVLHMADVKGLVRGVLLLQKLSLSVILGVCGGGLMLLGPRRGPPFVARGVLWGCLATVAVILFAGLGSLANFESLFILFHQVSFSNNLWLLDPRTDYLLMMFPEGFFLDATLFIAELSLAQAVLAGTAAGGYVWWRRRVEAARKGAARAEG